MTEAINITNQGKGNYSIKIDMGRLRPKAQTLPFNILMFIQIAPLSYTKSKNCAPFLDELLKALSFRVLCIAIFAKI